MAAEARFWHTAGMAKWRDIAGCRRTMRRFAVMCLGLVFGIVGIGGLVGRLMAAQEQEVPTLHVYANTIQVPVLVLGSKREQISPIAADRFSVSFDGGPRFRASHVRLEGDDPISLAILLDVSGPEEVLMPMLNKAIAGLAPLSLRPQDHVSVYALGCELTRSAENMAVTPARLESAVEKALRGWTDRRREMRGGGCQQDVHLWDAMTFVTYQLSGQPGRRVMLAVTDGTDNGSQHRWNELRTFAQTSAVAIFGMSYVPEDPGHVFSRVRDSESAFDSICELSGGLVFTASGHSVEKKLTQFVAMVRGRYIVEFPRPYNATRGVHELVVTIDKSKAFVRSTGISVPLPDSKERADPATVRSDPSLAPEVGTRHILTAPQ